MDELPKPDFSFQLELLRDILREETRKERRNLLAVSAVGIVIVKAGLIPTKISALGIDFSQADQRTLLWILFGIVSYFLIVFAVYAMSDILTFLFSVTPKAEEHIVKHTRLPNDTSYVHVYWQNGKRYTQTLDNTISSAEAQAKRHEWLELIHEISEPPPEVAETLARLNKSLRGVKEDIAALEANQQPIDPSIDGKLSSLMSEYQKFEQQEKARVADLKQRADLLMNESNALSMQAVERRAQLRQNLFRFAGSATLLTLARLTVDFLIPLGVSAFAIVSLVRGN